MNHLDVGFASLVDNILDEYFTKYFPAAVKLASTLRDEGYVENFVYTTHPWLIDLYLNCPRNLNLTGVPLKCPSPADVSNFVKAIKQGDITWHAGPMNMQPELFDEQTWMFALNISQRLDDLFGMKRKLRALSQRDVPGMTQAVIPLLVRSNIVAVTVGVNAASAPPGVPKIFNWTYSTEGTPKSVIALWHPNGYPDNPGQAPYRPGGISVEDCVIVHGKALCFAFRSDNQGPPSNIQEILFNYEVLRAEFPNARLHSSAIDDYIAAIWNYRHELPVVDKEIGDTWIQGIQSDPLKMAKFRAFMRTRTHCVESGYCDLNSHMLYNSSRFLIKLGEHTWGLSSVHDTINWSNKQFKSVRNTAQFPIHEKAWRTQRLFNDIALEALGNQALASMVRDEYLKLRPSLPDLSDYSRAEYLQYKCANDVQVGFNLEGGIDRLFDPRTKINWASSKNPLMQFVYITYNQSDFDEMNQQYTYARWFSLGVEKPNITANAHPSSQSWRSVLVNLLQKNDGSCDFYTQIKIYDPITQIKYGAPSDIWIHYTVRNSGVDAEFQMFGKVTTRMPESIMINFQPVQQTEQPYKWMLSKIGQVIDPMNVVTNGSQRQHVVDDQGIFYLNENTRTGLQIVSLDVGLANTITETRPVTSFPLPLTATDHITGFGFNVFNNLWNVNYIYWYPFNDADKDFKSRFSINFKNY
ncbi:uncharacterized protein LOC141907538 isoform X2 [Tubulanus polymorphus]